MSEEILALFDQIWGALRQFYAHDKRVQREVTDLLMAKPNIKPAIDGTTFGIIGIIRIVAIHQKYVREVPFGIWIPYDYPQSPPIMRVLPGPEHIFAENNPHLDEKGRVYLHTLVNWASDVSTIANVLHDAANIFKVYPPLRYRPDAKRKSATSSSSATTVVADPMRKRFADALCIPPFGADQVKTLAARITGNTAHMSSLDCAIDDLLDHIDKQMIAQRITFGEYFRLVREISREQFNIRFKMTK